MNDKIIAAQLLANMRKKKELTCVICGKSFIALSYAKTCCNSCRCKLKRKNKNVPRGT
jgi:hypothetical protein